MGKPESPKPISWNVASKAVWLGEVEATDEGAAMEKADQGAGYCPGGGAARPNLTFESRSCVELIR
jgi:hypothetical protein